MRQITEETNVDLSKTLHFKSSSRRYSHFNLGFNIPSVEFEAREDTMCENLIYSLLPMWLL